MHVLEEKLKVPDTPPPRLAHWARLVGGKWVALCGASVFGISIPDWPYNCSECDAIRAGKV